MNRVIYSLYIDIPENQFYLRNPDTEKSTKTKTAFKNNYQKLKDSHIRYANKIGVEYKLFEYDEKYKEYSNFFKENYPEINEYSIVNFYKIHLLDEMANDYDEVLYLDFDVIPMTNENFFEAWDLSKGLTLYNNNDSVNSRNKPIDKILGHSDRSPTAKYYNCQAMLIDTGYSPENDVINTGIIGGTKEHIKQLGYFENFKNDLDLMTRLRLEDDGFYPENIRMMFAYDNETLFSYNLKVTNTPHQWFDKQWHYFFDRTYFVPKITKFCHCINKEFDMAWDRYEKNNL